ncbi:hypothetical protein [Shewanella xiamenensis]|uniref:hypothetical protein n=1 Tax=Shewanella xiamenensis TaxID=332186 RepID=UPI00313BD3A8
MKQRPIIFNTEMVRAILDGRKTQTRRPMQPQPHKEWHPFSAKAEWYTPTVIDKNGFYQPAKNEVFGVSDEDQGFISPFGAIGDQLWVRETWRRFNSSDECGCSESPCSCPSNGTVLFKASHDSGESKWKPSIHMPRWAARIILEVTDVRVERLNDISEQDAKAEGFDYPAVPGMGWKFNARHNFLVEWDQIYGNRSSNHWVWVIEFKVISTTGGEA